MSKGMCVCAPSGGPPPRPGEGGACNESAGTPIASAPASPPCAMTALQFSVSVSVPLSLCVSLLLLRTELGPPSREHERDSRESSETPHGAGSLSLSLSLSLCLSLPTLSFTPSVFTLLLCFSVSLCLCVSAPLSLWLSVPLLPQRAGEQLSPRQVKKSSLCRALSHPTQPGVPKGVFKSTSVPLSLARARSLTRPSQPLSPLSPTRERPRRVSREDEGRETPDPSRSGARRAAEGRLTRSLCLLTWGSAPFTRVLHPSKHTVTDTS